MYANVCYTCINYLLCVHILPPWEPLKEARRKAPRYLSDRFLSQSLRGTQFISAIFLRWGNLMALRQAYWIPSSPGRLNLRLNLEALISGVREYSPRVRSQGTRRRGPNGHTRQSCKGWPRQPRIKGDDPLPTT